MRTVPRWGWCLLLGLDFVFSRQSPFSQNRNATLFRLVQGWRMDSVWLPRALYWFPRHTRPTETESPPIFSSRAETHSSVGVVVKMVNFLSLLIPTAWAEGGIPRAQMGWRIHENLTLGTIWDNLRSVLSLATILLFCVLPRPHLRTLSPLPSGTVCMT